MIKSNRIAYRGAFSGLKSVFGAVTVGVILLFLIVGCSSGPSQSPEKFVKNFITKNIPMIDFSVANFYVKEEQSGIRKMVSRHVDSLKQKGTFASLKAAKYDFSNISVKVIAHKEDYIDDEERKFLKVEAKGTYSMTKGDKTESFKEDEIIILESEGKEWKVTEKLNPWK